MGNDRLHNAKTAKYDEFYTQYNDIEVEIQAYVMRNPDVFRGMTVLCPCDDPEWSNFTRYFASRFQQFGLKKLISTSFAFASKGINWMNWEATLFERENPHYDPEKSPVRGKIFVLDRDTNGDQQIDIDDLQWEYLEGDGDFRSEEVTKLRDEADFVVTNPPFSLFREFIEWVMKDGKKFAVIGNMNAITYKEVFPLIKENRLWLGATHFNTGLYFYVPDGFQYAPSYKFEHKQDGRAVNRVAGVCWFTNIEHNRRHEPLSLISMKDNIGFSRHKEIRGIGYQTYDNYEGIDVPYTDAIPSDYDGVMGVPVTFLDKYCPEQFEIVKFRKGNDDKDLSVGGKCPYFRILIQKKR